MLTEEKLSEITKKAIGTRSYAYRVKQSSSQYSCTIWLYAGQPNDDGLVATIYVSEGNVLGSFHISFVPELSNKEDREVMRMINSNLFDYFNKRLEPKFYIRLLNDDYGYLALDEDTELWHVTSIDIAKADHEKVAFTADEINAMSVSKEFAHVDLWNATEKVGDDKAQ